MRLKERHRNVAECAMRRSEGLAFVLARELTGSKLVVPMTKRTFCPFESHSRGPLFAGSP